MIITVQCTAGKQSPQFCFIESKTFLYSACDMGHKETVKILLEYGAQVNQANNVS